MKKKTKFVGIAAITFLLAGCQDAENEESNQNTQPVEEESQSEGTSDDKEVRETEGNNNQNSNDMDTDENEDTNNNNEDFGKDSNKDSDNNDTEQESTNESTDNDSDIYGETQVTSNYFIDSHTYSAKTEFLTAFSIKRKGNQDFSPTERLETSLIENDPTAQDILGTLSNITVDWPTLYIKFNAEGTQLSTTTAISSLFYDSLLGISDLYGIEEIVFSNPDGERSITVAERMVDQPIIIEDERERGLSRGYYTIYDKELEQTLFLSGGELEEPVANENGEPLSFPETVEAMSTVDKEGAFYASAMVEGLEVDSASLKNGVAAVQYTMDEKVVTEADRIVFENAIQLAALDFHAWKVRLINDTSQEIITYPLVGQ